jgi:hypothetical protein
MLCILIRCTYDKKIEIIEPLIQEFQFWPPGGQVKNFSRSNFGLVGPMTQNFVHMYKVSGQYPWLLQNVT